MKSTQHLTARDLMVGDWVSYRIVEGKLSMPMQVCLISESEVYLTFEDNEADPWICDIADIVPISLSPEILEKNGFEHLSRTSYYDYETFEGNVVRYDAWDKRLKVLKDLYVAYDSGDYADIKVHTLQHILKLCEINLKISL